jgi:hypothetical protein
MAGAAGAPIINSMYTIQFGQRAHFLTDDAAERVLHAIEAGKPFVTVPVDLAADGGEHYVVTLNVDHIVALIKHRDQEGAEASGPPRLFAVR